MEPTILAVIPARGGSKGLPGKKVKSLAGKPMIAWTIEAALACQVVTRTIVSTDVAEIVGATLCTHAWLAQGVIVNTGAIVEHHCRLADFVHVAPGAVLTGRTSVGERVTIGAEGVIGAGSVVTCNIPACATAVGVPARLVAH